MVYNKFTLRNLITRQPPQQPSAQGAKPVVNQNQSKSQGQPQSPIVDDDEWVDADPYKDEWETVTTPQYDSDTSTSPEAKSDSSGDSRSQSLTNESNNSLGKSTPSPTKKTRWEIDTSKAMAGHMTPELRSPTEEGDNDWLQGGMRERDHSVLAKEGDDVEVYVNDPDRIPSEPATRLEILPPKLDRVMQRTTQGLTKTYKAASQGPTFAKDTMNDAYEAGMSAVAQTDLNNLSILTPVGVLLAGMGGASSNVTAKMAQEANGSKDTSAKVIVAQAEAHLAAGAGNWTEPQQRTFEQLLEEAQNGLEDFANNDYVAAEGAGEAKAAGVNKTIGDYWKVAREAGERRNPTKSLLSRKAPELYCLVMALEQLSKWPYQVQKVTPQDVYKNAENLSKRGDFIGASALKTGVIDVAVDAVKNAVAPADRQVKYLPISIEGPGTGKSSCAEAGMKASGLTYFKISGEMIKSWVIPKEQAAKRPAATQNAEEPSDGEASPKNEAKPAKAVVGPPPKDVFDLLMDEIKSLLRKAGSTNVTILLDDLHIAYDTSETEDTDGKKTMKGPFARDRAAFDKLMDVLKNVTDATQDRVPGDEMELSPLPNKRSIKFPISFKRVGFYITGNTEHDAFSGKKPGGEWLASRLKRMPKSYMTAEDRMHTATESWRGKINHEIAHHYGWGDFPVDAKRERLRDQEEPDFARVEKEIDQDLAKKSLATIAEYDIGIATSKFSGENGHRGLIFFLTNFSSYMTRQLNQAGTSTNRDLYDMSAYDMEAATQGISDYNKAKDAQLSEQRGQQEVERDVQILRLAVGKLTGVHQTYAQEQLTKVESESNLAEKKAGTRAVRDMLNWYGNRVQRPTIRQLLTKINEEFKDMKANETSADVDRYRPTKNFIVDLWKRKEMTDAGTYDRSINKLIRVRLTDPTAYDQGFFEKLGKMMGGVPVHFLDDDSFLASPSPLPSFNRNDFEKDAKLKEHYDNCLADIRRHDHIVAHNGTRYQTSLQELKRATRSYFYMSLGDRTGGTTSYWIFDPEHVESIIGGKDIPANSNIYKLIKSKKTLGELIDEHELPRLVVADSYMRSAAKVPSAGEPYLVVRLTPTTLERINAWAAVRNGGNTLEPNMALKVFQEYVSNEVLNKERVRANGKDIDPRGMRLFLVDGTGEQHTPVAAGDDKIVSTVTLAPPTLEGRGARAESAINRTLVQVIREAYWKTDDEKLPAPVLTDDEVAARAALVQFDREKAQDMRGTRNVLLTTTLVEKAAVDLAKLIGERFTLDGADNAGVYDPEQHDEGGSMLADELPSLGTLTKGWQAEYDVEINRIDTVIAERKAEEERERKEKQAAEDRRFRYGGGLGGYGGYRPPDLDDEADFRDTKELDKKHGTSQTSLVAASDKGENSSEASN